MMLAASSASAEIVNPDDYSTPRGTWNTRLSFSFDQTQSRTHGTYNTFAFTAGAEHVGGDDPVFDILIRRLGGSGDVKARRMKLEVVPVTSGAVEEQ